MFSHTNTERSEIIVPQSKRNHDEFSALYRLYTMMVLFSIALLVCYVGGPALAIRQQLFGMYIFV